MSGMSDLFDSLDAGDLDEIAGKLNVAPKKEVQPEPIVEQVETPVVEEKKERKYVKFDNLNEQVADLFDNSEVFPKDIPVPKPKAKAPQVKPRQSFVESAARALTNSAKNTPRYEAKPLRETVSVEERIKLLEQDLFRVQAQATPNTLVAGIGASLDSGGGAVWLWDLEDVNIGTPLDGVYPAITNGSVLMYDTNQKAWVPGAGGSGGTIQSDDIALTTPITDGNTTVGDLPAPGNITNQDAANSWFKSSLEYIDTKIDGGSDNDTEVDADLKFDGSATTQNILVYGAANKRLAVKVGSTEGSVVEVMNLSETGVAFVKTASFASGQVFPGVLPLAGGAMTGAITFHSSQPLGNSTTPGILSLIDNVDSSNQTVAGSAKAVKTAYDRGSTGVTDAAAAKAVADAALPLAGGALTGDTTYTGSTSGDTNLQTKASVNTLIAGATGGSFVFKGTVNVTTATAPGSPAAGDFYINTTAGTADSSWTGIAGSTISADQLIIYSGSESRWFAGAVEDNSSFLLKTGGTMTGKLIVDRNQQAATSNSFVLKGNGQSDQLLKTYIQPTGNTNKDWVQYFGETDINDNQIQTKASVAATVATSVADYLPLTGGTIAGDLTVNSAGDFVKERHGDDATKDFVIQGATTAAPTVATGNLLQVYRNTLTDSSLSDVVSYFGGVSGANNIQTKSSVENIIAANPHSNLLTGGVIKQGGGSANTSGNLTIFETSSSNTGRLYLKDSSGNTNVIIYPTGDVEIGDRFTLGNPTDTNANKVFRFIGTASPNVKFYFGQDVDNLTQSLTVNGSSTTVIGDLNVGFSSSTNAQIKSTGELHLTAPGVATKVISSYGATTSTIQFKTGNVDENSTTPRMSLGASSSFNNTSLTINRSIPSGTSGTDITIKGFTKLAPTNSSSNLLIVERNTSGSSDAVNYYGCTSCGTMVSPGGSNPAILEHTDNILTNRSVAFNFFQNSSAPYYDYNVMNSNNNGGITQVGGSNWSVDSNYNKVLGMVLMYIDINSSTNLTAGMNIGQLASGNDFPGHFVVVPCTGDNDTIVFVKIDSTGKVRVQNIAESTGNSGSTTKVAYGTIMYPSLTNYRKPA